VLATSDFSDMTDAKNISQFSSLSWMRGAAFPNQNEVLTVVNVSGNSFNTF
jgi:hypothetical protein